jgi:hypothetical protein
VIAVERRFHLVAVMWVLLNGMPSSVFALDPSQPLGQLHHTAWTAKDGLTGVAGCLAQPADGGLWIGFQRGGALRRRERPHNQLQHPGRIAGQPCQVFRHRSQRRRLVGAIGGIAYLEGGRWKKLRGGDVNLTSRCACQLTVDRERTLWVAGASPDRIFFRRKGQTLFQDTGVKMSGWNLLAGQNGDVWTTSAWDPVLRRVRDGYVMKTAPSSVHFGYRDLDGAMWVLGAGALWRWIDDRFVAVDPPPEVRQFDVHLVDGDGSIAPSLAVDA